MSPRVKSKSLKTPRRAALKKKLLPPEQAAECAALDALFRANKAALGLTQARVAAEANMSSPAVGFYLKGINALNLPIAMLFSRLLSVPMSAFSARLAAEATAIAQASDHLPVIDAIFECVDTNGITGTTSVPVKRIERQDDGSVTVVLDYWPSVVVAAGG